MIQSKQNQILAPNLVAFISQNEKTVWFFYYHLFTCSVWKMVLICLMQNIGMCLLYKSNQIARLVSHLTNHFSKWMFTAKHKNATKFGSTNEILHILLYHQVTSYGYIIMDSCIIIPPATKLRGGILDSPCSSVRPSVRPSVGRCPDDNSNSFQWI